MTPGHAHVPDFQHRFGAEVIAARSLELAEQAARVIVNRHPELAERYRPQPQLKWREHFLGRLADLAAAMAAAKPEAFVSQVSWAAAAFAARRVPVSDLRLSLEVLRAVVLPAMDREDAPLVETYIDKALAALDAAPVTEPTRLSVATPLGKLAAEYLLKVLEGDRLSACARVLEAAKAGTPVPSIYLQVFIPVQHELGRMWHLGEINVAEEHFATATTQLAMAQLLAIAERRPFDGRVMVAGAVEGNAHDIGVRVVADFFELAGWRTIYLGANVPADDLVSAAVDFDADLVAISAMLTTQLQKVEDTVTLLREKFPVGRPKIVVGGAAFKTLPDLWRLYGADAFAETADRAVEVGDLLVPSPKATPEGPR